MKIKQHSSEVQIAANHTPYRSFKVKVLNELLFTDKSQYTIADEFKINQSMISKWLKKKDDLFHKAAASKTKHLLKYCPARKYLPMYETLLTTFREARKKDITLILIGFGVERESSIVSSLRIPVQQSKNMWWSRF